MRRHRLGILLIVLLALSGCGGSAGSGGTAGGGPVSSSSGPSWLRYKAGQAQPTPGFPVYTGTPSPWPSGYLPLPSGGYPTPAPSLSPSCYVRPRGTINYAEVVPAATSAAVTFYNPGGDDLVEFRITAIDQNLKVGAQRDVGWTVVTPSASCGFMTATVRGLDPASYYVFSVDAVRTRQDRDPAGPRAETIARSMPVRTR